MLNGIVLTPKTGTFDIAAIQAFLATRADVLLDPVGSGTYLVCGMPEHKDFYREQRLENPKSFPLVALVIATPTQVLVAQEFANRVRLLSAREIVRWLIAHLPCSVADDRGNDLTARVEAEGPDILYAPEIPPEPR